MLSKPIRRRGVLGDGLGFVASAALPETVPPFPITADAPSMPDPAATHRSAMRSGGPGKDGSPSIDRPRFVDAGAGSGIVDDEDVVFGLIVDGDARAYLWKILVAHKIVNEVGGVDLAVSQSPTGYADIAFQILINRYDATRPHLRRPRSQARYRKFAGRPAPPDRALPSSCLDPR
jgi:hypothetical protein